MTPGSSIPREPPWRARPSPPPSPSSSPHREQTGTRYDFIEKKVVPVYDYTSTERDAGTIKVKTDRDGDFSVSIPTSSRRE